MLTANKLKGEFMSKNFEIINKEINENNIIANLFIFPFAGGGVSAFR